MNSMVGSAPPTSLRPGDHVRGNPGAPLVLIEYGDFQCPTCKQAAPAVDLLLQEFGDRLLFVFRNFPLESIHPDALAAAESAEAAAAQGAYWEMHHHLFQNQQHLAAADLLRHAQTLNLEAERFQVDLRTHAHLPRIREDVALGQASHVRATPGFFLNGRVIDVSFGMRSLHDAVSKA